MIALSATGRTIGWTDGTDVSLAVLDDDLLVPWPVDLVGIGLGPDVKLLAIDDGFIPESDVAQCLLSTRHGTYRVEAHELGWADPVEVWDDDGDVFGPARAGLVYRDSLVAVPADDRPERRPVFVGSAFDAVRDAVRARWRELLALDFACYDTESMVMLRLADRVVLHRLDQWFARVADDVDSVPADPHDQLGLIRAETRPPQPVGRL